MEHREDAALCQRLIRAGSVPVGDLVACAEAQRDAREGGRPIPRLREMLLARGVDPAALDAAAPQPMARRRRRHSSTRRTSVWRSIEEDGVVAGDRLSHYVVTKPIARGSMGAVFEARCERTGEQVALKVLAGERARKDQGAQRFLQEAQLLCSLRHPGLVPGLAFGCDAGRNFFAMEYVEGPSLKETIQRRGPLPEAEALEIAAGVARTLAYLHGEGIVHRDVKPANILLGPDGVRLCDLGLAREVHFPSSATASCETLGTPCYMAPEQARESKEAGPKADLYSLGVTLFHALAGRPPFLDESGIVVLSRHLFDTVPDVRAVRPSVSPAAAAVVRRLTLKEPSLRYASAAEVAWALEACPVSAPEALRRAA